MEFLCSPAAALCFRTASAARPLGIRESWHRVLGTAQAVWRSLRDHLPDARSARCLTFLHKFGSAPSTHSLRDPCGYSSSYSSRAHNLTVRFTIGSGREDCPRPPPVSG